MVTEILLIRGSILEVTGYHHALTPPPSPLCGVVGVFFVDSEKMTFLEIVWTLNVVILGKVYFPFHLQPFSAISAAI